MALLVSQNYLRISFSLFKFIRTVPFSVLHRDGLNVKNPESPTLFRYFLTIYQSITNESFLAPHLINYPINAIFEETCYILYKFNSLPFLNTSSKRFSLIKSLLLGFSSIFL